LAIRDAVPPIQSALPPVGHHHTFLLRPSQLKDLCQGWIVHIEVKSLHFRAAAQYRKSVDDTERNKSAAHCILLFVS
jgi:hypothetical protein